jgi:ABC-type nitrate/sulfonate/bicarbonate transport system permease component
MGYAAGITIAALLTALAVSSRIGTDLLETLTSMFNPLPAIALLPLALLWFGLGNPSLIFVMVHSVLWAVALNTHSGFTAVSNTLRMVGQNCGLTGLRYVIRILIPAAFPSILTGLKIGWAFAWRTLIAAELVFGVSPIYMNYVEEKDRILAVANRLCSMKLIDPKDTVLFTAAFRTRATHASNLIEIHKIRELMELA